MVLKIRTLVWYYVFCIYIRISKGNGNMRRIKLERERLGYNQTQFAGKLNVANNTLNNYEKGVRTPDIAMLGKMADLFGCTIDYLCERTDIRSAAVIEQDVAGSHVKIELDDEYYKTLTPGDVQEMLKKLHSVGFDVKRLAD